MCREITHLPNKLRTSNLVQTGNPFYHCLPLCNWSNRFKMDWILDRGRLKAKSKVKTWSTAKNAALSLRTRQKDVELNQNLCSNTSSVYLLPFLDVIILSIISSNLWRVWVRVRIIYNDNSANITQRDRNKRAVMCVWQIINCQKTRYCVSHFQSHPHLVNGWLLGRCNEERKGSCAMKQEVTRLHLGGIT